MSKPKNIPETLDACKVPAGEHTVIISTITRDPKLQVRGKLDDRAVLQYRTLARSDSNPLPPVQVIRTPEAAFLVDGWHRVTAHEMAGKDTIRAVIKDGSRREAGLVASLANVTHGVRIKPADKRRVFRQFISSGGSIEKGRRLSYRELEARLGGLASHTALRNWMEQDFPKIFAAMASDNTETLPTTSDPRISISILHGRVALSNMDAAWAEALKVERDDLERRQQLYDRAVTLVEGLRTLHGKTLERLRAENPIDEFDTPLDDLEEIPAETAQATAKSPPRKRQGAKKP